MDGDRLFRPVLEICFGVVTVSTGCLVTEILDYKNIGMWGTEYSDVYVPETFTLVLDPFGCIDRFWRHSITT